jgi:hypothetical protein
MSDPETEVATVEQGEVTSEPETMTCETTEPLQAASSEAEEEKATLEESDDTLESEENQHDDEIPAEPVENEIVEKDESIEKELHGSLATQEVTTQQPIDIIPNQETTAVVANEETTEDDHEIIVEAPAIEETPAGEVEAKADEESKESVKAEETMTNETTDEDNDKSTEVETHTKTKRNSLVEPVKTVDEEGNSVGRPAVEEEEEKGEDPWVTPDSNIRDPKRRICIVTTAALPWRTGTAVNPLLRALYLTRGRPKHYVTLVIPWCEDEKDRQKTLGKEHSFANREEHEAWIRDFCRTRAGCAGEVHFL